MTIEKVLGYECSQCIKQYGHSEERCAFCEENGYYRGGITEEKVKIANLEMRCKVDYNKAITHLKSELNRLLFINDSDLESIALDMLIASFIDRIIHEGNK